MGDGTASFGEVLRRLRSAAILSQEELAERAGLSRRGISDLERGLRQAPRLETVRMLADGLALNEADRAALLAAARPALLGTSLSEATNPALASVPAPLTRLIGRAVEFAALRDALRDDAARLVTVTGAGGSGKTRLALEIAREAITWYPDGIVFIDLSPLTDADLVVPTIAAGLGVQEAAEQPLIEALTAQLVPKQLLLVLDNCEQVLASAPEIAGILAACPNVCVLATSREAFRVRGEREFPLSPLPLPAADGLPPLAELARNPAVALFMERAAAKRPDFALASGNAEAVATICRRLDGLPLAIELAAARVSTLSPAALLSRLERRLPLLTGGGRDLPTRQRTMRDAIAWSYDLLAPEARILFRRLALFAGGFTLDAAEAVADDPTAVLDVIGALSDQSLVRQMPGAGDEPRYMMLETMREFGLEQLTLSGEEDETRARHAQHFVRLAGGLGYGIQINWHLAILERIAAERDNVRLALAWCDEHEEFDALLRLSNALSALWVSPYQDGLSWIDRVLERTRHIASPARVQTLNGAGIQALVQGNYARAVAYFAEELVLARDVGDAYYLGQALVNTGFIAYRRGEYGRAEAWLHEALGALQDEAKTNQAAVLQIGRAFLILGDTALAQRQFDRAADRYTEALDLAEVTDADYGFCDIRAGLGGACFCRGDLSKAATLYGDCLARAQQALTAESLARVQNPSFTPIILSALFGLAGIAAETGDPAQGARLFVAAEGITAAQGIPIFPRDRPVQERSRAALCAALGGDGLAAGRIAAETLTITQAVAEAADVAAAVTFSPAPSN
jgi:predicted ATPase/DNA-binding XRE family transcriptional regulator